MELKCEICGKDLLDKGAVVFYLKKDDNNVISEMKITCIGECDKKMQNKMIKQGYIEFGNFHFDDFKGDKAIYNLLGIISRMSSNDYKFDLKTYDKLEEFLEILNPSLKNI